MGIDLNLALSLLDNSEKNPFSNYDKNFNLLKIQELNLECNMYNPTKIPIKFYESNYIHWFFSG